VEKIMAVKKKVTKKKKISKKKIIKKSILKTKLKPNKSIKSKYLEIRLSSLVVRENGRNHDMPSSGTILINWIYPRPGKQRITAIIPFSGLQDSADGQEAKINFSNSQFSESLLFKELVEGESVLTAEIAITKSPGLISKILETVTKIGIKNLDVPYIGSALGVVLDSAGLTKQNARVIGKTRIELSDSSQGEVEGELFIPEAFNIYKSNKISFRAEDIDLFDEDEFEVGGFNGVLTLNIT